MPAQSYFVTSGLWFVLLFTGTGHTGVYAAPLPEGPFFQTCTEVSVKGEWITAKCMPNETVKDDMGSWTPTRLDMSTCERIAGSVVLENDKGRLACKTKDPHAG
ncbi:hypothetical protein JM93_02461 [Roseibium hamelinense]|uniref:CVNH domain-containing protein n=1 Tax=Roseibium hamelinense TaxID=150831 RepID=A0A562T0X3_9HYPH|nr:hypothetical protein JM93_02461 [Roseibium hamelinense]